MPAFTVNRSIEINRASSDVHQALVDFNTWPIWSPWLYQERECTVTYQGVPGEAGHGYDWSGNKIGSGGMKLLSSTDKKIDCDLQFLKPFKSQASVVFTLDELSADKTRVNWGMDSSMPFFMFFMIPTMTAMISADYDRGLVMLKDYLELGQVPSHSSLEGLTDTDAVRYVGVEGHCSMADIGPSMTRDIEALMSASQAAGVAASGSLFSIYHRFDIKRGEVDYTVALPVSDTPAGLAAPLLAGERPAARAYKLRHTGPYRHIPSGWAMAMGEMRHRKIKADKKAAPFEVYVNSVDDTPEEELVTDILIPVRR